MRVCILCTYCFPCAISCIVLSVVVYKYMILLLFFASLKNTTYFQIFVVVVFVAVYLFIFLLLLMRLFVAIFYVLSFILAQFVAVFVISFHMCHVCVALFWMDCVYMRIHSIKKTQEEKIHISFNSVFTFFLNLPTER